MLKIYIPNTSNTEIGGGFTFIRNFKKGLNGRVEFVNKWQDCDIIFVFGITTMDKGEVYEAIKNGKKFILRVDNIPRKSRNRRQSPAERLKEFGAIADKVIYQSQWAKEYAGYFAGEGIVINNGVDTSIFNTQRRFSDGKTYLYFNYNDNPNKRFDEAIYWFDLEWRKDNQIHLKIVGNVPKIYLEHPEYNWDLTIPAKVEYLGILETPEAVVKLLNTCDYLLYPSFAEAAPNTIAEALACGMEVKNICNEGGAIEMLKLHKDKSYTIQEMGNEYLRVFEEVMNL